MIDAIIIEIVFLVINNLPDAVRLDIFTDILYFGSENGFTVWEDGSLSK